MVKYNILNEIMDNDLIIYLTIELPLKILSILLKRCKENE